MESVSTRQFGDIWRNSVSSVSRPPDVAPSLDVVADEFYTFWETARESLGPAEFAVVDRAFQDGLTRTRTWLHATAPIDEEKVALHLRSLISEAEDRGMALARLRGAQAALFDNWILVKASFDRLDKGRFFTSPRMGLTDDAASRLLSLSSVSDAALATIVLVTPLELAQVHALTFESMARDGSLLTHGDARFEIPDSGACFLRAHRLVQLFKGMVPSDNLFGLVRDQDRGESSSTGLRSRLNTVARKTGLIFPGYWMRREVETNRRWIARHGISIERLNEA